MNIYTLFSKTIKDIETRLRSNNDYEILMIAGLLRKLLLDEQPLVDQVNRSKRLKISYSINHRPDPGDAGLVVWSVEDSLDPETSHLINIKEVTRDELLAIRVLKISDHIYTIREVILHISHVEGAIHAGRTKEEKDKILKKFISEWNIGGYSASLRLLKAIARVVLKGIKSLENIEA